MSDCFIYKTNSFRFNFIGSWYLRLLFIPIFKWLIFMRTGNLFFKFHCFFCYRFSFSFCNFTSFDSNKFTFFSFFFSPWFMNIWFIGSWPSWYSFLSLIFKNTFLLILIHECNYIFDRQPHFYCRRTSISLDTIITRKN